MSSFCAIDLSKLASPAVVEELDFMAIREAMLADLIARDSDFTALVPSDPAYKLIEVVAYRELLLRNRINAASRAVMLAFAIGQDLDHLAALFGVERLLVTPQDLTQLPPQEALWESDERLRQRVALALEGFSTAGPKGAYRYHGLAASALVKDISVTSPSPGEVLITVLSSDGNGSADEALLTLVHAALNDERVRPLTDHVVVQSAQIVDYTVEAQLYLDVGPDPSLVLDAAQHAVRHYVQQQHRLGQAVTLSGLYAALHQTGVRDVDLWQPKATLTVTAQQAAWCSDTVITQANDD